MADKKISALTAVTTPLAGTEVLPIVQSGSTKKVAVSDLTAGRAVSATQFTSTIATGTPPLVVASTTEVANLKAATATTAAGLSATLAIASGGTNQTAFTGKSGDVAGLVFFDGTKLANSATVTNVGYDTVANTLKTNNLDVGGTFTITGTFVSAGGYAQGSGAIITEATTSRTLSAGDNGKIIYCTSGSATTITCATGLGAGFNATIIQGGAGKVTMAAGAATLVSYSSLFSTMGQYAVVSLISPVADEFIAAGNLGV